MNVLPTRSTLRVERRYCRRCTDQMSRNEFQEKRNGKWEASELVCIGCGEKLIEKSKR